MYDECVVDLEFVMMSKVLRGCFNNNNNNNNARLLVKASCASTFHSIFNWTTADNVFF